MIGHINLPLTLSNKAAIDSSNYSESNMLFMQHTYRFMKNVDPMQHRVETLSGATPLL